MGVAELPWCVSAVLHTLPSGLPDAAPQNASEVERVKAEISTLQDVIKAAQDKQKAAKDECKKLEKDMEEFKTNKDGKIEELKVSL